MKANVLDSMLDVFAVSAFRAFSELKLPFYIAIFFYLVFPIVLVFGFIFGFYERVIGNYAKVRYGFFSFRYSFAFHFFAIVFTFVIFFSSSSISFGILFYKLTIYTRLKSQPWCFTVQQTKFAFLTK